VHLVGFYYKNREVASGIMGQFYDSMSEANRKRKRLA
jgi:hypothetical protein